MQVRVMPKTGDRLSALGFGCMRYPHVNGKIDVKRTERQIIQAIELGVNYFDTAYIYHAGRSESILGDVLAKGYRDRVKIATKMPPYLVHSQKDMENILSNQLRKLRTDRIDYYLLHAMNNLEDWHRLKKLGIEDFIERMKKEGRIINIGFSWHGDREEFKAFVDAYPWDFCQIQYNYMDEYFQAGREGLQYAASKGLGVIVMEPLRGGRLVGKMPQEVRQLWSEAPVQRSAAEWAFRWLWDQPEVITVLSGLNEEAHIDENARIASETQPGALSEEERSLYRKVSDAYTRLLKVGCTGCGYCMPCPAGVDIPMCFSYYNSRHLFKARSAQLHYLVFAGALTGGKPAYASQCIRCGKCEAHCPQHIPIREKLKDVASDMEVPGLKPVLKVVRKFFK